MALVDAFLLDEAKLTAWIAVRSDGALGSGTAQDPYNATVRKNAPIAVSLSNISREAVASSGSIGHGLTNGDIVLISDAAGLSADTWNGSFGIYGVSTFGFKYMMKKAPANPALGNPQVAKLNFPFDEVMRQAPANIAIRLGPGTYLTRGFGANAAGAVDERGWQPKSGQKIVGAGIDVTTLQLVGADRADYHYHAIGMQIEPTGTTAIAPLEAFEASELTIDCNVDNQPGQLTPGYAAVACGAVRIFGTYSRISRVKVINWGTKSLREGCFVISIIQASGKPSAGGQPLLTETQHSGIEDCIAIQPSKNSIREATVLHMGGLKNSDTHAQTFATAGFIRRNFVDCQYHTSISNNHPVAKPSSSHFITSQSGTQISGGSGTFVGKRDSVWNDADQGAYIRFYNPRDAASRWNGFFPILSISPDFQIDLSSSEGTTDDSSLVLLGTEFRAISITSTVGAVVECNHIHNCWIGGPYSSPLDDSMSNPSSPPTLAREERLDALNALNTRSLVVRNNFYKNVTVGPYWNMGGVSAARTTTINYNLTTGVVTITTANNHKLWLGARVKIGFSTAQPKFDGLRNIISVGDTTFDYQAEVGLTVGPVGTPSYQVVSGVDFLTIDGNVIELADLDETEFAIKEYPLATNPALQTYRPFGIIVTDNQLSELAGPYVHRQVFIRNNKIRCLSGTLYPSVQGLGIPACAGMQLAGIEQLHVTYNVLDVNPVPSLRTFRCGILRFFHNTWPNGDLRRGWKGDKDQFYDEPEGIMDDAFVLSLLHRKKR